MSVNTNTSSNNQPSLIEQARAKRVSRHSGAAVQLPAYFDLTNPPINVGYEVGENEWLTYKAGKLNGVGMARSTAFRLTAGKKLREMWIFDENEKQFVFADEQDQAEYMATSEMYGYICRILTADVSSLLTFDEVAGWPFEFVQKCYDAAVTMNPEFDEERAAKIAEERGKAQAETRDANGAPISEEQADKSPLG